MNKFYQPGAARQSKVNDLFARIAPRYDLINDLQSAGLHRLWKKRFLRMAEPKPGERALDLCCGTGDISLALAAKGLKVVGLDFSQPMLAVARQRMSTAFPATSRPLPNPQASGPGPGAAADLHFICGDASHVPYPDASFDLVTISYGLRNLPDWRRGLKEMWRLTRPGGRLLVLDFGHPDNVVWRRLYFAYLRWGVPLFGRLFCGDPETHGYILESLRHYPGQRGVDVELRSYQSQEVRVVNLLGGMMSINYARKPGP